MGFSMKRREFIRLAVGGAVGTVVAPAVARAQTTLDSKMTNQTKMPKRIVADHSCGIIIDVQRILFVAIGRT